MRNLQMLEDLEKYHGTVLVWAGLGGGSISLPYLAHEAFGDVDPRMQVYGYMNDSEFIAECNRRGIKLFGIVFEVQGWEYPDAFSTKLSDYYPDGIKDEDGNPVTDLWEECCLRGVCTW